MLEEQSFEHRTDEEDVYSMPTRMAKSRHRWIFRYDWKQVRMDDRKIEPHAEEPSLRGRRCEAKCLSLRPSDPEMHRLYRLMKSLDGVTIASNFNDMVK